MVLIKCDRGSKAEVKALFDQNAFDYSSPTAALQISAFVGRENMNR